ncbi:exopolysaccharide production repressor protein [Mesorhizobium sp. ArgA1]
MFCHVMALVVSSNALAVYFVSRSIRMVIGTALTSAVLLQVGYFGSVLLLMWRSSSAGRSAQKANHFDSCQERRRQSPTYRENEE